MPTKQEKSLMFTGIIETVGKIVSVSPKAGGMTLTVQLGPAAEGVKTGDSIAVNGVCLTIVELSGSSARFDVSAESLNRTTLKNSRPGRPVNLERAMSADARFGGHVVQGHIDGVGKIISIRRQGDFAVFAIEPSVQLLDEIVIKGSVALDGISLTVAAVVGKTFTVALIPETLSRTTWKQSRLGDAVNIETDVLLKAVRKQLEKIQPDKTNLTEEKLKEMGF
jgi:riboflavin synthase